MKETPLPKKATPLVAAFICAWALVVLTVLSLAMAGHMVPLPIPSRAKATLDLLSGTVAAPGGQAGSGWKVVHVLVAGCACSGFTAQSLAARKPSSEGQETVLIVGGSPEWQQALVESGYDVRLKDGEQLAAETGIEGGPWLLVISPAGNIAYSGGYAAERPRPGIVLEDAKIFHAAIAGAPVPTYPAFGCAATASLQGRLDPLGVCRAIQ